MSCGVNDILYDPRFTLSIKVESEENKKKEAKRLLSSLRPLF